MSKLTIVQSTWLEHKQNCANRDWVKCDLCFAFFEDWVIELMIKEEALTLVGNKYLFMSGKHEFSRTDLLNAMEFEVDLSFLLTNSDGTYWFNRLILAKNPTSEDDLSLLNFVDKIRWPNGDFVHVGNLLTLNEQFEQVFKSLEDCLGGIPTEFNYRIDSVAVEGTKRDCITMQLNNKNSVFEFSIFPCTTTTDERIVVAEQTIVLYLTNLETISFIGQLIRKYRLTSGCLLGPDDILTNIMSFRQPEQYKPTLLFSVVENKPVAEPIFELFGKELVTAILDQVGNPIKLHWDVYRPNGHSVTENYLQVSGNSADSFVRLHISVTGSIDLPNIAESQGVYDVDVCDQADAHHLALWLSDQLGLINIRTENNQLVFES